MLPNMELSDNCMPWFVFLGTLEEHMNVCVMYHLIVILVILHYLGSGFHAVIKLTAHLFVKDLDGQDLTIPLVN